MIYFLSIILFQRIIYIIMLWFTLLSNRLLFHDAFIENCNRLNKSFYFISKRIRYTWTYIQGDPYYSKRSVSIELHACRKRCRNLSYYRTRLEKPRSFFTGGEANTISLFASSEKNQTGCESQLQSINQDTINRKHRFRALCWQI